MTNETPESASPEPTFRPTSNVRFFASAVLAGMAAGLIQHLIF